MLAGKISSTTTANKADIAFYYVCYARHSQIPRNEIPKYLKIRTIHGT